MLPAHRVQAELLKTKLLTENPSEDAESLTRILVREGWTRGVIETAVEELVPDAREKILAVLRNEPMDAGKLHEHFTGKLPAPAYYAALRSLIEDGIIEPDLDWILRICKNPVPLDIY